MPEKAGRARKISDFYIIGKQQSAARKNQKPKQLFKVFFAMRAQSGNNFFGPKI
jgi:hypothetical protein